MAGSPIYTNTIDRWDEATGENLIERIAGVSDYLVAVETYRAAVRRWPGAKITLRNRRGLLSGRISRRSLHRLGRILGIVDVSDLARIGGARCRVVKVHGVGICRASVENTGWN